MARDRAAAAVAATGRTRSGSGAGRRRSGCSCFTWIELVVAAGARTRRCSSRRSLGYTVLTLAAQVVLGRRHVDAPAARRSRSTSTSSRGCRCFEIRDGELGFRRPLGGLPKLDPAPGHRARSSTVMIGTVTFDGLSQGQLWKDLLGERRRHARRARDRRADRDQDRHDARPAARRVARRRLLPARHRGRTLRRRRAVVRASSRTASSTRWSRSRRSTSPRTTSRSSSSRARRSPTSASDPFGQGWDLFGTVDAGIDYTVFPQEDTWYVQVAVVVVGHVAALALAHDRALTLYGDTQARRPLAVLDARRDGRLHLARALAARPGRLLNIP